MMKKILLFTNVFATILLSAQTLTNTENYIYTSLYLEPVATPLSTAKQIQQVQYLDGLGRVKQNIAIKNTPTGKDLILPVIYDQNGKIAKSFLPLPASSLNGTYHSGVTENSINSYYGVSNAYSEVDYEKSPIGKILKASSSGDDWQINGNKTKTIQYFTNNASEVKRYKAISTWDPSSKINNVTLGIAPDDSFTTNGYYNGNTLYKYVNKDEDDIVIQTFINSSGKKILVRKIDATTQQSLDTYYVYDDSDNLVYIIPPEAAKAPNITQLNSVLNILCYQYRYDKYNRLAESKLPGKDFWEYIVYDKQGRITLTQDSNQHNKAWSYVKYDRFGRPVYNGIYTNSSTRATLQAALDNASYASSNESTTTSAFNSDGQNIYYTKTAIPSTNISVLSVNYYDKYPLGSPAKPSTILGSNTMGDNPITLSSNGYSSVRSTKGLATATLVRNLEDNQWSSFFIWYDQKGRSVGSHSINHLGGFTKTEVKLDFSGFPLEDYTFHKRLDSDAETLIKQRYVYDDQKRLKIHYHQVNDNPEEILAQNEYDEFSRLKQKKVGGTSLSSPIQIIDYDYNIHGWLTGINKGEFSNPTNKLFAYDIRYNDPTGNSLPKYNGNISEVNWKSVNNNIHKRYNYSYDPLNRLSQAQYSHPEESIPENDFYNETISYDLNGNIKTLQRNAPSLNGISAELIDDLDYSIDGNKIVKVEDYTSNPTGYEGGGNELNYDGNGNMITMPDRLIEQISYNYLDLPNEIRFQEGKKNINYLYRADGTKLKKQLMATGENGEMYGSSTEYLDSFHYSSASGDEIWAMFQEAGGQAYEQEAFTAFFNEVSHHQNVLKFVPTAEGFYDFQNNKYIYQYRDHLGNVRVNFLKNNNGIAEVLDQNDYYPFGLNHVRPEEPSYFGQGSYTNYKYNGKELQESGMYDYGWRQYMPDLGRWGVIDQLAEHPNQTDKSPYSFTWNNSINFVDPDGRCPDCPTGGYNNGQYWKDSNGTWWVRQEASWKSMSTSEVYIDEVVIQGGSSSGFNGGLWGLFGSSGGSGGGGFGGFGGFFGGGNPAPDPYAEYKKELEAYRRRQARTFLYTKIDEYWKSQALSVTVGGEVRGILFNANLSLTLAFNLSGGTPQLFGSAGGKLGFDYGLPGGNIGVQLGAHQTYGNVNGEKYNDVFGGMEGESTGWAGSAFLGGEQNQSSMNGVINTNYGVKNTYMNLGVGYGLGRTTSTTVNINKWLKQNVYYSPQFY